MINIVYDGNFYYEQDKNFFNELAQLILSEPRLYVSKCKSAHKKLYSWVNSVVIALVDPCYKFSTKCYWILTGMIDFPVCPICGKPDGFIGKNVKTSIGYFKYCSSSCANLDPIVNAKKEAACLNNLGVKHPLQSEVSMKKYKSTCVAKFGVDHNFKATECIEKRRKTWQINYGCENPNQNDSVKIAKAETFMLRYGQPNPSLIPEFVEKRRQTMLSTYGVEYVMQIPGMVDTVSNTVFERYGVNYISQTHEFRIKAKQKYFYDGQYFSSAPEIAFYIWHVDSGIRIEYQPECDIWYEYAGRQHRYHPDFSVGGVLYELKGNQFLNSDGTWINPYDRSQDGLYEAKHACCIRNGVRILYKGEYSQYVEYVERRYGKSYLGGFKRRSEGAQAGADSVNSAHD